MEAALKTSIELIIVYKLKLKMKEKNTLKNRIVQKSAEVPYGKIKQANIEEYNEKYNRRVVTGELDLLWRR